MPAVLPLQASTEVLRPAKNAGLRMTRAWIMPAGGCAEKYSDTDAPILDLIRSQKYLASRETTA